MPKYTYTLQDQSVASLPLALWVKRKTRGTLHARIVLDITRSLQAGKPWCPGVGIVEDPEDGGMFCSVEIEGDVDPYKEMFSKWDEHQALLERGAAGDAEAAIAYCKLELNHEVSHGAFAG
jgi:hypothetical protein